MDVHLWEWSVGDGARHSAAGVSMTRHGAMEALALTLTSGQGPALGLVARICLVDGVAERFYSRAFPEHMARYADGVNPLVEDRPRSPT